MHDDELILLGRIIKAHGFNGAVVIALEDNFSDKIEMMESVFVESDGRPVPFFIESAYPTGTASAIVEFRFYDSDSSIAEFIGSRVLVPGKSSPDRDRGSIPMDLVGFTIISDEGIEAGVVISILSLPMQVMLEIESAGSERILVPYHVDMVIDLDSKRRQLILRIPDGLLTLND